jgi:ABC-2 type transport system permease protein
MSDLGLTLRQVRFTNKAFWRNPASAFFTFAFPLMFLVIFTTLFGNSTVEFHPSPGEVVSVKLSTFYVAGMAAFGVITACYTNIAISVTFARDSGVLKRVRGTPLPGRVYLLGRILHAMVVGLILLVVCVAFGRILYDASIPTGVDLARTVAAVLVGGVSFCALGLACTTLIPNADAAPAIVNITILPLLFLSDVFFSTEGAPAWVQWVGKIFPIKHFAEALQAAFIPAGAVTWTWTNILVLAAWGAAGLVIAARFFSWEPRR